MAAEAPPSATALEHVRAGRHAEAARAYARELRAGGPGLPAEERGRLLSNRCVLRLRGVSGSTDPGPGVPPLLRSRSSQLTRRPPAPSRNNSSLCLLKVGRLGEALRSAEEAVAARPTWAKARFRQACALEALGEPRAALAAVDAALALAPRDAALRQKRAQLRAEAEAEAEAEGAEAKGAAERADPAAGGTGRAPAPAADPKRKWEDFLRKLAGWREATARELAGLRRRCEAQERTIREQEIMLDLFRAGRLDQLRRALAKRDGAGAKEQVDPNVGAAPAKLPKTPKAPAAEAEAPAKFLLADLAGRRQSEAKAAKARAFAAEMAGPGFCIVTLPRNLRARQTWRAMYEAARAFFDLPTAAKDRARCPSGMGFLNPLDQHYEGFQVRERHGQGFAWPPGLKAPLVKAYDLLKATTLVLLEVLAEDLGVPFERFRELLEEGAGVERLRTCRTTLKVLDYTAGPGGCKDYPDHTDLAFLTVAPRGTQAALRIKSLRARAPAEYVEVEPHLGEDDVVVFAGDLLARLTNNAFPAVLHHPRATWADPARPRMAAPFFLRAREDAVLDTAGLGSPDPRLALAALPPTVREPLAVAAIEANAGGCRTRLPWKLGNPYYASFDFSD